jgi:hypothetical protein
MNSKVDYRRNLRPLIISASVSIAILIGVALYLHSVPKRVDYLPAPLTILAILTGLGALSALVRSLIALIIIAFDRTKNDS